MKVFCTLTREQATLYAAVVQEATRGHRRGTEGIERKGRRAGRADAAEAGLQPPRAVPGRPLAAAGPLGQAGAPDGDAGGGDGRGERALVFTQFAEMGGMLQRHLQETFGREVLFLHGGVPRRPARPHGRAVPGATTDGPPVFVLSLKAGGTGLNLTARQPRLPLRPLVEPGRREPGHRPRLPHRPDAQRPGPQVRLRRARWRSSIDEMIEKKQRPGRAGGRRRARAG